MPRGSSKSRRSLRRARYLANIAASSHNPTGHRSSADPTVVGYNDGNPPAGLMNVGSVQDAYPRTQSSSNSGQAESLHLPDDSLSVAFNDLTVVGRNNNNTATGFQTVANFGVANVVTQSTVADSIETDFDFEITSPIVSDIGDRYLVDVAHFTVHDRSQPAILRRSARRRRAPSRFLEPPDSPPHRRRRLASSPDPAIPELYLAMRESIFRDDSSPPSSESSLSSESLDVHASDDDGYSLHRSNESITAHFCGLMSEVCPHCHALYFASEKTTRGHYSRCCHNGATSLEPLREPTPLIKSLLTFNDDRSAHFVQNILYYNNCMAMASIGIKTYEFPNRGPPIIRINGLFMHNTGSILPREGCQKRYAQLYICDPQEAIDERRRHSNGHCREDILALLAEDLRLHNPYVQSFNHLKTVAEQEMPIHKLSGRILKLTAREKNSF